MPCRLPRLAGIRALEKTAHHRDRPTREGVDPTMAAVRDASEGTYARQ
ncbi:MAG TPA: hypothetical protein VFI44_03940 [Ornithinibacter sp.]|nr:hypothetical protein [Ornithinibacter sp.]